MIYAPHILQKKVVEDPVENSNGNPVFVDNGVWVDVCQCRCDDNTTREIRSENGNLFRPAYHVVCPTCDIKAGDEIRCIDGCSIRGKGKAIMVKNANFYKYTEIWM